MNWYHTCIKFQCENWINPVNYSSAIPIPLLLCIVSSTAMKAESQGVILLFLSYPAELVLRLRTLATEVRLLHRAPFLDCDKLANRV